MYVFELWSHDRIYMTLDEKRTREDGDVKKVLVKFSDAHYRNTESNQQSCVRVARAGRETRGIELNRMRWVTIQPLPLRTD